MNYRYLGRTGLKVSEICLGAMTFGRESDEATSYDVLNRFVEAGGNFIDTANVYGRGVSETILGKWLAQQPRESLVIASKVRFPMGEGVNEIGLSRKHILASVDASLQRLQTDYIDLFQVHCWDFGAPLEETLSTLDTLVKQGKVRYLGASNYAGWQLQKAVDLAKHNGWEPFSALQPLYNLLDRELEWELVDVCLNEGLGILPWSPLRGGWLSGKYRRGSEKPVAGTRVDDATRLNWSESWEVYANERTWNILDALFAVAEAEGKTPAQVALNWVGNQPGVTSPIIGARTLGHLDDNLGAVGWRLSAESQTKLDEASHLRPVYPYYFIDGGRASRGR